LKSRGSFFILTPCAGARRRLITLAATPRSINAGEHLFFSIFPTDQIATLGSQRRDIAIDERVCLLSANYSSIDLNYENQLQVNLPARSLRPEPHRMHKYKISPLSPASQRTPPQENESEKRRNFCQGCRSIL
jgi:hypothetical protein